MRMPGMDGAALLTAVMEQYPHIIRIMLTGHADDRSILQTIPVVHQFLAKPSDPETLKELLLRACALQELISSEPLKSLVAGLGTLPSLPEVYAELQKRTKDPECSIGDIAVIIEKDLAMSTKVLQLVNSAFYGLYKSVDSPARAVNLLGLDTIKTLVLGVGIFTEMAPARDQGFSVSSLWKHSVTVAGFAKKIALVEGAEKSVVENSFIAGIVHDVGKLLLFSNLGDQYLQAVGKAHDEGVHIYLAEKQVFDADHGDVGGYLIGLWGLPGPVVEATTFHHKLEKYPEASFCPALAVHAADVAYYILNPDQYVGAPPAVNLVYLEQAGLGGRFDQWLELCKEIQSVGEQDD
jgi:HD-like signal output (HDOD) protein